LWHVHPRVILWRDARTTVQNCMTTNDFAVPGFPSYSFSSIC
jgi:hypothetical protein